MTKRNASAVVIPFPGCTPPDPTATLDPDLEHVVLADAAAQLSALAARLSRESPWRGRLLREARLLDAGAGLRAASAGGRP